MITLFVAETRSFSRASGPKDVVTEDASEDTMLAASRMRKSVIATTAHFLQGPPPSRSPCSNEARSKFHTERFVGAGTRQPTS